MTCTNQQINAVKNDDDITKIISNFCNLKLSNSDINYIYTTFNVNHKNISDISVEKLIEYISKKIYCIKDNIVLQKVSLYLRYLLYLLKNKDMPKYYCDFISTLMNIDFKVVDNNIKLIFEKILREFNEFFDIVKKYDMDISKDIFKESYDIVYEYIAELIDTVWYYDVDDIIKDVDIRYFEENGLYLDQIQKDNLFNIKVNKINIISTYKYFLHI